MPWTQWKPGDPITINRIVWDDIELDFVQDVFERDWFGPSLYAGRLQDALRQFVGTQHAQLLNSGSSALLLAAQALKAQGRWRDGDLILHPACTFPTSCNPIWQVGCVPVFVDVEEGYYVIDAEGVEEAIKEHPNIAGAIIPHLIGNIPDMARIKAVLGDRPLIEDCCDTLGGSYRGQQVGTLGTAAAFSFYGSHHITTAGVGGALLTDDDDLHNLVHSMAFWGRRFNTNGDPYHDFVNRYTYETVGYDMQMTEIQAAFGLAQMTRIAKMNGKRWAQFEDTDLFMRNWEQWLSLPKEHLGAEPSWFGYPVLVRERAPFKREHFVRWLLDHKIEIRPLFAGNLMRQPAYQDLTYVTVGEFTQADRNGERAFFLPAWGGMLEAQTEYLFDVIERFMVQW